MPKLIIANWKMNLSVSDSLKFVSNLPKTANEIALAAPATFLYALNQKLHNSKIKLAGQNVSEYEAGAYTGEISAKMLKEAGCQYCLVGHSERRIYFQETDKQINNKIKQLLKLKIKPVLCIGENAGERKRGLTLAIIKKQLSGCLAGIKDISRMVIAYEPVWAISTFQTGNNKLAASEKDIVLAHDYIKKILQGYRTKILYGGTVNEKNAKSIFGLKNVDGALVGGASLNIKQFGAIIKAI